MKPMLKKFGRFLLWALPALLAIYVAANLADYCWYRAQIPIGFHDADWTGKWDTEQYLGTTGRLLVRMPDPLPENTDFKAEALVYYPIYCPWKTGQFVKMDFVGNFSPDTNGWIGEIAYIPFISSVAPGWPWLNARIGLQYTWYEKFNGTTVGAASNNTLFLYAWLAM